MGNLVLWSKLTIINNSWTPESMQRTRNNLWETSGYDRTTRIRSSENGYRKPSIKHEPAIRPYALVGRLFQAPPPGWQIDDGEEFDENKDASVRVDAGPQPFDWYWYSWCPGVGEKLVNGQLQIWKFPQIYRVDSVPFVICTDTISPWSEQITNSERALQHGSTYKEPDIYLNDSKGEKVSKYEIIYWFVHEELSRS